jgi:hypothetical protein
MPVILVLPFTLYRVRPAFQRWRLGEQREGDDEACHVAGDSSNDFYIGGVAGRIIPPIESESQVRGF